MSTLSKLTPILSSAVTLSHAFQFHNHGSSVSQSQDHFVNHAAAFKLDHSLVDFDDDDDEIDGTEEIEDGTDLDADNEADEAENDEEEIEEQADKDSKSFLTKFFTESQSSKDHGEEEARSCKPYTKSACKAAGKKLGLQLGGSKFKFAARRYRQKGCYYYKSGKYKNQIYFGKGGSKKKRSKNIESSSKKARPEGYDCKWNQCNESLSGTGDKKYRGCQRKTVSGKICQRWSSKSPHKHNQSGNGIGNHNKCRNPDNSNTIWCYTTDSGTRWEYCEPIGKIEDQCDETEKTSVTDQSDYRGCTSKTISGKTCQRWTNQYPHKHKRTPGSRPNFGLGKHKFCRNPDGESKIWCYTTDSSKRWEFCDVGVDKDAERKKAEQKRKEEEERIAREKKRKRRKG